MKALPAYQIERIRAMRAAGVPVREIAAQVGCCEDTVSRWAPRARRPKPPVPHWARLPPATLRAMRGLLALGDTDSAIAGALGVGVRAVRWQRRHR